MSFARALAGLRLSGDHSRPEKPDSELYVELKTDVGPLWISRLDEVMRHYIERRGRWEDEEGDLLRTLIRPGCRFLDVGANVGYFSLLAARAAPRTVVEAVEPHPESAMALRWNLWSNGVRGHVHQVALDDRRRRLTLVVAAPSNVGDARVSASGGSGQFEVEGVPADELFAGKRFDVVKIDVQGWEPEVVRGMRSLIAASRDIALVVELWPAALRERDVDPFVVLEMYSEMGLDIVTLLGSRLRRLTSAEVVRICEDAGPYGQVNLLLRHQ